MLIELVDRLDRGQGYHTAARLAHDRRPVSSMG